MLQSWGLGVLGVACTCHSGSCAARCAGHVLPGVCVHGGARQSAEVVTTSQSVACKCSYKQATPCPPPCMLHPFLNLPPPPNSHNNSTALHPLLCPTQAVSMGSEAAFTIYGSARPAGASAGLSPAGHVPVDYVKETQDVLRKLQEQIDAMPTMHKRMLTRVWPPVTVTCCSAALRVASLGQCCCLLCLSAACCASRQHSQRCSACKSC